MTPARVGVTALGLLAAAACIGALTRPHETATATQVAEKFEVDHVVR